ncbi:CoA transferase subunit A [Phytohabitans flavus]|uniref:CoA transferase subunit A n=1 Tax=Phytohabitans flavus TaxID=1076124 RepID=UPI0031E61C8A
MRIVPLADAVADLVPDGADIAIEGFSHLVPFAAAHEIIRQGRTGLTVTRMVPDILVDQLIGAGAVTKLVFSWAGNPGVGSLHRFRDAVEHGWPHPIALEEHTHAGLANAYVAGASGLPFAVLRGYVGTSLAAHTDGVRFVRCPFTDETLAAVRAVRPDVAVIHAQRADRRGNVQLWGISGVQKEAVLAARRSLVTVEEVVEELSPVPGATLLPYWALDTLCVAEGGARPSYTEGYGERDNDFYAAWDPVSRDRTRFTQWLRGVAA